MNASNKVFLDDAAMMAKFDAMGGTAPANPVPFHTVRITFRNLCGMPVPGGPFLFIRRVQSWSEREARAMVLAEATELKFSEEVFPLLKAKYDYYGLPLDVYGEFSEADGYNVKRVCVAGTSHSVNADRDMMSFITAELDDEYDAPVMPRLRQMIP